MQRNITIKEICDALSLEYKGNNVVFEGLNLCNRVSQYSSILTYVTSSEYSQAIYNNLSVKGLIVSQCNLSHYIDLIEDRDISVIIVDNPEKIFYDIHEYLYKETDFYDKFRWKSKVGKNCDIHPSAIIEDGVIIGDNVTIGPNTVVRKGTVIRDRCIIGCNSTIGSEGFQVLRIDNCNRKIIHCGGVELCEDVYVGDNTAVPNALFEGATIVGRQSMIDNLVHVGHNVKIGENVVLTATTVLCGSSNIESNSWIGVNSCILNRVTVGNNAKIGMGSVVTRDIPANALAYGNPAKKTSYEKSSIN